MIRLMNSAMMPQDGLYIRESVSAANFRKEFQRLLDAGEKYESYIGYHQTARILSDLLGREIPVTRQATKLDSGNVIFAIQLKYRLQSPHEKAGNQHGGKIEDYQFSIISYTEPYKEPEDE